MIGFLIVFFVIFIFTIILHRQTLNEHARLIDDLHKQLTTLRKEVKQLKSTQFEQTTAQHTFLPHTLTNTQKATPEAPTNTSTPIPSSPPQEFNELLATELMTAKQVQPNMAGTQENTTINTKTHSASSANPAQVNRQRLKKHPFPPKNKNTYRTPSLAQRFLNAIWTWFSTGNPMLKIGVAILFLGLAFLLRFASDYIDTPLWLRYLAVGLSGLGATGVGIYLAQKRREYGLILQGFGLAVMYLTTLSSLKLSQLITPSTAFVLMLIAVLVKIVLALRQDAKILAQIALIGGLATPILTSSGSNHYVVLFTYLALLNTGIAIIAQFKTWRSLNAMSLLGTFAIAFLWQEQLSTVQLA